MVSVRRMIFSSFHINRYAGPEYHIEPVLIDGDLFNQPPDQLLVVFGYDCGLLKVSPNMV